MLVVRYFFPGFVYFALRFRNVIAKCIQLRSLVFFSLFRGENIRHIASHRTQIKMIFIFSLIQRIFPFLLPVKRYTIVVDKCAKCRISVWHQKGRYINDNDWSKITFESFVAHFLFLTNWIYRHKNRMRKGSTREVKVKLRKMKRKIEWVLKFDFSFVERWADNVLAWRSFSFSNSFSFDILLLLYGQPIILMANLYL